MKKLTQDEVYNFFITQEEMPVHLKVTDHEKGIIFNGPSLLVIIDDEEQAITVSSIDDFGPFIVHQGSQEPCGVFDDEDFKIEIYQLGKQ